MYGLKEGRERQRGEGGRDHTHLTHTGRGDFRAGSMQLDHQKVSFSAQQLLKHFQKWMEQIVDDIDGGGAKRSERGEILPRTGELSFSFLGKMTMPEEGEDMPPAKMHSAQALVVHFLLVHLRAAAAAAAWML
jgi:hypothetical protein